MQVQDMIRQVRYEIGEPAIDGEMGTQVGSWSDQQIIGYLNDAQGLLERPARIQAQPVNITLTAGTYAYNLPADCLEDGLRKVVWNMVSESSEVEEIDYDRWSYLNLQQIAGQNQISPIYGAVYAQWAGQIYLFPNPEYSGDTITVSYYKTCPQLVNITDTSLIPARFHKALCKYAIAECQAVAEESQLQMLAMQEFERLQAQLTMEMAVTNRDMPARVRLRR